MPVIEKSRVRASTEKFFQLLEYWNTVVDHGSSGMRIEFLMLFCRTREFKVDFLHVCVNLMHYFSFVRTVLVPLYR